MRGLAVFSSGFATSLGVIPAVVGKADFILLDKLSHACLVDAARLSGATLRVFPHNDCGKLAACFPPSAPSTPQRASWSPPNRSSAWTAISARCAKSSDLWKTTMPCCC
jgi:hypothetical protein